MTSTQTKAGRRVVAQISTTLDGRVSGPKGPADMEVVARYAGSDAAHARSAEALAGATTALLGRPREVQLGGGAWPDSVGGGLGRGRSGGCAAHAEGGEEQGDEDGPPPASAVGCR